MSRLAFGVERLAPELLDQFFAQVAQDGIRLAFVGRGRDHEVVGDQRDAADIEQDDVAGLFFAGQIDDLPGHVERVGAFRGDLGAVLQRSDSFEQWALYAATIALGMPLLGIEFVNSSNAIA